jgi:hypothetical protein
VANDSRYGMNRYWHGTDLCSWNKVGHKLDATVPDIYED